jgi:hypothetical protein
VKHATVKLDGVDIPLIGIPADATEETCQGCGQRGHLSEMTIDEHGQVMCGVCLTTSRSTGTVPPVKPNT